MKQLSVIIFMLTLLLAGCEESILEKTDDLQILLAHNKKSKVCFINGEIENFKITTNYHTVIFMIYRLKEIYQSKQLLELQC